MHLITHIRPYLSRLIIGHDPSPRRIAGVRNEKYQSFVPFDAGAVIDEAYLDADAHEWLRARERKRMTGDVESRVSR